MVQLTVSFTSRVRFLMRKFITFVRSRLIYRTFDAAMTAPLLPQESLVVQIKAILSPELSNYRRVSLLIRLIDHVLPDISKRLSQALFSVDSLPFATTHLELMNFGSGATVFWFKSGDHHYVLKVYRRSLGKSRTTQQEIALYFQKKYDTISSWYEGHFIIPSYYLILHAPLRQTHAVAALQPYIRGPQCDFFKDLTNGQILLLLSMSKRLRQQFIFFAKRTLEVYAKQGLCMDFIGRDNLLLIGQKENAYQLNLMALDYGIFDVTIMKQKSPKLLAAIEAHIARLDYLLQEAEKLNSPIDIQ